MPQFYPLPKSGSALSAVFVVLFLGCFFLSVRLSYAQNPGTAFLVSGLVADFSGKPVAFANLVLLPDSLPVSVSDEQGRFSFSLPAGTHKMLVSHATYEKKAFSLRITTQDPPFLRLELKARTTELQEITVKGKENDVLRAEASTISLNPVALKHIPTPFLDFNQALVSGGGLGIVGNNELSSSYAVRGGNFDENLVYVNGILIYRPFLGRSGQQEGLSFVNPEMVESVDFSSGGWQAKYGDKLSSVLNIRYKTPEKMRASAVLTLLGGSLHLEGRTADKRFTHLIGIRYKSARYLLNTLDVKGQYLPRFADFQTYLSYRLNKTNPERTKLGLLLNYADNFYRVYPQSQVTQFGTFRQILRVRTAFEGNESLRYRSWQGGITLNHHFSKTFRSRWIASGLLTKEREFSNLEGGYLLCDVNKNPGSSQFDRCTTVLGMGITFNYARNFLSARIFSLENRNRWQVGQSSIVAFGVRLSSAHIEDQLHEYAFTDSADYVSLHQSVQQKLQLNGKQLSGYLQQKIILNHGQTLTYGGRFNYWSVNRQWLLSPRLQYAYTPPRQQRITLTAALGLYRQPPFYRELRNFQGKLNQKLKAQNALHSILGVNWAFHRGERPFRLIVETYYKKMWDVITYDLDNLRLRYYADNAATAYAYGIDVRLSGEFIPNTESWFNLSLMQVKENKQGDKRGYIRRPSDQRLTAALFFQDHLPNNPSIRVYLRYLYGTGLPYGPPNSLKFRNSLSGNTTYNRADIGFSKRFALKNKKCLNFFSIGLEVLNLFGVRNNISFNWLKDFQNRYYAVPNSLSQRFFNLKLIARY